MSGKDREFHCKTDEGHIIKILAELLQNNIKNGCYRVDSKGMSMNQMDNNKHILINLFLDANNFKTYKLKSNALNFGFNHSHLYKMLKSIKKKDSIAFFIEESKPNDLGIEIIPKENNRTTTSTIKIQSSQNVEIELPDDYGKSVIIPSNEFQKLCKDASNISGRIKVIYHKRAVKFVCSNESVYSRQVLFGEVDNDCTDEDVEQEFETEVLTRISKIAGLSSNLHIFQKEGLPMRITSNISNLGKISIYVKDVHQIEEENILENE